MSEKKQKNVVRRRFRCNLAFRTVFNFSDIRVLIIINNLQVNFVEIRISFFFNKKNCNNFKNRVRAALNNIRKGEGKGKRYNLNCFNLIFYFYAPPKTVNISKNIIIRPLLEFEI